MTKIYISGPMTGLPDLNYPAFYKAQETLEAYGFDVINPAGLNPDKNTPWDQCMRKDIAALCECDAIYLLNGWEKSQGAMLELQLAHRLNMEVIFEPRK